MQSLRYAYIGLDSEKKINHFNFLFCHYAPIMGEEMTTNACNDHSHNQELSLDVFLISTLTLSDVLVNLTRLTILEQEHNFSSGSQGSFPH